MTHTILTVTAEQLAALDVSEAVKFVAELLWAEVRRLGVPTTHVHISMRINVPDGGVDASIDTGDSAVLTSSFIPNARCAFQIKAGESFKPWQEADIRKELFGDKPPFRGQVR